MQVHQQDLMQMVDAYMVPQDVQEKLLFLLYV
jgi:hypothetical protein